MHLFPCSRRPVPCSSSRTPSAPSVLYWAVIAPQSLFTLAEASPILPFIYTRTGETLKIWLFQKIVFGDRSGGRERRLRRMAKDGVHPTCDAQSKRSGKVRNIYLTPTAMSTMATLASYRRMVPVPEQMLASSVGIENARHSLYNNTSSYLDNWKKRERSCFFRKILEEIEFGMSVSDIR